MRCTKGVVIAAGLAAVLLALGAPDAWADPGPGSVPIEAFKKADRDRDGKISLEEAVKAGWVQAPRKRGPAGPPAGHRLHQLKERLKNLPPEKRREAMERLHRMHQQRQRAHAKGGRKSGRGPHRAHAKGRRRSDQRPRGQDRRTSWIRKRFLMSLSLVQQRMFLAIVPEQMRAKLTEGLKKINRLKLLASLNPEQRGLLMASSDPEQRRKIGEALQKIDGHRGRQGRGRHGQQRRGTGVCPYGSRRGGPGGPQGMGPFGHGRRGPGARGDRPERTRRGDRSGPGRRATGRRPHRGQGRPTPAPSDRRRGPGRRHGPGSRPRGRLQSHEGNPDEDPVPTLGSLGEETPVAVPERPTPEADLAEDVPDPDTVDMVRDLDVVTNMDWLIPVLDELERE